MKKAGLLLISLICCTATRAQLVFAEDSLYNAMMARHIGQQNLASRANGLLYTGRKYVRMQPVTKGHPFFTTDQFVPGTIFTNEAAYDNLRLLYDIETGEVVLEDAKNNRMISLVVSKIDSFKIGQNVFVNRRIAQTSPEEKTAFYRRINGGSNYAVYAQHEKLLKRPLDPADNLLYYSETVRYFVEKNGLIKNVSSRKDLLEIFSNHKKEMNDYMKEHKINFKNVDEVELANIVNYYFSLAN